MRHLQFQDSLIFIRRRVQGVFVFWFSVGSVERRGFAGDAGAAVLVAGAAVLCAGAAAFGGRRQGIWEWARLIQTGAVGLPAPRGRWRGHLGACAAA